MISTVIDMHLETLAGYIFDDDKLVTYKWLSRELGLHVNLAKQILWQFWKEHEKRKDVLATFTLMGYLENDIFRVEVVEESNLSLAKEKFCKLTGEHLYSLQKTLPDIELLALCGHGDNKQAAIVCKEIILREAEELSLLRWGSKYGKENTTPKSNEKSAESNLMKTINPPNDMFRKIINNKETNVPTKSKISIAPKEVESRRGQKRQGSKDIEAISNKKRRQIVKEDYQSSEEESDTENPEEPEIDHDPKNVARASPPKYKIEGGKRKLRKVVDKTSMDENGYFVTKKEYVYETCSDTEESTDAPKLSKPPKPAATDLKVNRNNKQSSLLNFFKKT